MTPTELRLQSKLYIYKFYVGRINHLLQAKQGDVGIALASIRDELTRLEKDIKMTDLPEEDRLW